MVFLPSKSVILDDEILTNEWKTYYGMIRDYIAQMVGGDKAESITITEGNITPSKAFVLVDSENELEVDDIERINVTNFVDGNWICLTMANKDHAIVLKNGSDGDGAVFTYTETDEKLDYGEVVVLRLDGNVWRQVDISGYMRASADDLQTMTSTKKVATLAQLQPYIDNKSLAAVGLLAWAVRKPEGFVPCDNTQEYPASNFPVVKKMLDSGLLPSVTYDEYNSSVTSTGLCEKFGYSADSGKFYVPYLKAQVIQGTTYYPYICLYNSVTAQSLIDQQAILDEGMTLYNQMKAEFESFRAYVEQQMTAISTAVEGAVATVNTTRDKAVSTVNQTSTSAVNAVNNAATTAVQQVEDAYADFNTLYNEKTQGLITTANNQIVNINNASEENINKSRIWATGEDAEVETLEAGEHSSRGYADLSMAIANTPEDTPIDASTLVALDVIRGPRGYTGEKGAGLPTGGTAGQAVIKKSNADYDYEWANIQVDTSDCVKLTGAQTIAGVKTFTDNIIAPNQIDYTNITNCITEIPQDIKIELNSGTLKLKAGSKVYVPNGANVYNAVTISSDMILPKNSSAKYFIFLKDNGATTDTMPVDYCYTGKFQPTITHTYAIWHDTASYKIKWTGDNGSTWVGGYSFPICVIVNNTPGTEKASSIEQVFNGFGYVGKTVFALPGVKGLIPNGRNADGSLKNTEFRYDSVKYVTFSNGTLNDHIVCYLNYISLRSTTLEYDEKVNLNWLGSKYTNEICDAGRLSIDSANSYAITSFTPKTAFHAVDWNDYAHELNSKQDIANLSQTLDDSTTKYPSNNAVKTAIDAKGGGLEIGDIGFAPLGIDEAQNKRRYLNGQVISQAQFVSFTNKIKAAIQLTPSLATTETNWQAEVTNSKLGQCGKFVIDDTAGTIRLPKVVNIQGLQDLSLMGGIKAESLPNITGEIQAGDRGFATAPTMTGAFGSKTAGGVYYTNDASNTTNTTYDFDASRSSLTYQDGAPVQQEAIQYPYFIQVATGVEESVDVTREIELNNPFSLLDYKWSEYELSNASWLLSNGAFHSGTVYTAVYELLLKIKNGTETKDGVSVKLSTEAYTDTDFVINTADTTFRLPVKIKLASGSAVVGNGMTLGLENGNTTFGLAYGTTEPKHLTVSTELYGKNVGTNFTGGLASASLSYGITTDPTKSGIETSSSGLKLYFYVGETIQDANVIAASQVLTKVANGIDRTVATDRETVVGWGMPDYSAGVSVSFTVNAIWTAPSDGILILSSTGGTTPAYYGFINEIVRFRTSAGVNAGGQGGLIILNKNDTVKMDTITVASQQNTFIPLKGVN